MVSTRDSFGLPRNHYAVVTVDAAGWEVNGWDFRTLDSAKTFGDQLRRKGLRVEVWARDKFGRKLARLGGKE
jgi:hypothetical protein